jgi:hypothetical protein
VSLCLTKYGMVLKGWNGKFHHLRHITPLKHRLSLSKA